MGLVLSEKFARNPWLFPPVGLHAVVSLPIALKAKPINADHERLAIFVCD
jgi:hypothetical protein